MCVLLLRVGVFPSSLKAGGPQTAVRQKMLDKPPQRDDDMASFFAGSMDNRLYWSQLRSLGGSTSGHHPKVPPHLYRDRFSPVLGAVFRSRFWHISSIGEVEGGP